MSTTTITGSSNNVITTTGIPNWSITSGNTANTIVNNPYLYTGMTIESTPFNISFVWGDKDVSVKLKNGNDIFKLARIFTEILDNNNIEYEIKTNKKRKR